MKKKFLALLLASVMVLGLTACGGGSTSTTTTTPAATTPAASTPAATTPAETTPSVADSITLWAYPVGGWGDEAKVKTLTDAFTADTGIKVQVEWLAYADGDDKVNTALSANNAPDLVMEGPERLVANWGANGHMVDLADIVDATDKKELFDSPLNACTNDKGEMFEYPLCMTAHCMAINLDAFKEAGADQYLNLTDHTWSTDNFIKAVDALYAKFGETVGAVYCAGQGGDQGTRELIINMYGGSFTDAGHTKLTWDDPNNIKAMQTLYDLKGIDYDASLAGGDEIAKFYQGVLKMAFCWNSAQQLNPNSADTGEGKTVTGEEIVYMHQPTPDGSASRLGGGIWGFGAFNTGDDARIAASKEFIKWMCDSEHTVDAVSISNFFPVRATAGDGAVDLGKVSDNAMLNEYFAIMVPDMGDYYQVIPGWAGIRTEWWTMLQAIGSGTPVADAVAAGNAAANAASAAAG